MYFYSIILTITSEKQKQPFGLTPETRSQYQILVWIVLERGVGGWYAIDQRDIFEDKMDLGNDLVKSVFRDKIQSINEDQIKFIGLNTL